MIGGALMLNDTGLSEKLRFIQFAAGSINSPFEAFLLLRSIKTLAIRMQKHEENALSLAAALNEMPQFEEVIYPGLSSHPQHALAKRQMSGFSGMISARLKGDFNTITKFFDHLKLFTLAESLGGVESLVNHPQTMTHASVPEGLRWKMGIDHGLIRFSVGIENSADLIGDVLQAIGKL